MKNEVLVKRLPMTLADSEWEMEPVHGPFSVGTYDGKVEGGLEVGFIE